MTQDARQFRGRGFTIIELILALSMVAIVALTLYQSLRVAFRSRDAAMAAVEPARTIDLAMRFIQEDLQNAIAPNAATSSDDSTTATGTTSGTISGGITGALPSLGTGTGPGAQAGTSLTLNITYNTGTTYILAGPFEGVQSTGGSGQEADDLVFYTTSDSTDHVDGNGDLKQVELTVLPVSTTGGGTDNVLVRARPAISCPRYPCRRMTRCSAAASWGSPFNTSTGPTGTQPGIQPSRTTPFPLPSR